jgi:hypothetical protein
MSDYKNYASIPVPRTIRLPGELWKAAKDLGKRRKISMGVLLEASVAWKLNPLVEQLRGAGLKGEVVSHKLVRVALSKGTLEKLAEGRQRTGIPGVRLLALCLEHYTQRAGENSRARIKPKAIRVRRRVRG